MPFFLRDECKWNIQHNPGYTGPPHDKQPVCTCDERLVCEDGAGGPRLPQIETQAGNTIYNLTSSPFTTEEYLVNSFPEFIDNR